MPMPELTEESEPEKEKGIKWKKRKLKMMISTKPKKLFIGRPLLKNP